MVISESPLHAVYWKDSTNKTLASEYKVHPTQIAKWRKELLERAGEVFDKDAPRDAKTAQAKEAELYRQIGQLKVEVDWLKKKSGEIFGR